MLTRRMLKKAWPLLFLALFFVGCVGGEKEPGSTWLFSCGERVVTAGDYQDALKLALQGYPYESLSRGDEVVAIRQGVYHQLQEELLLLAVADEKGVSLQSAELESAVREAREGYPEGAFEKELMNRGISLETWRRRLEKHLLVKKVLKSEFGKELHLTYDDFQAARRDVKAGVSEQGLIQQAKRVRMEAGYRHWRRSVEGKYSIEVNGELWEKILEEGRP
ncbi:hypothetical protein DSLASN_14750 [Desulfoluna limicola]|uniref:Lipoprotein n=1 Tax=Desulfoluna limicola TaxID=2810562 RepID=A0ABM7PE90_9BACT|nr:SurA N-terminal domain-containing protein [Desulfoluna limicola]BCS95843.1 hypothetical protein DSLASN_14750 [Desulfoluna limicola]